MLNYLKRSQCNSAKKLLLDSDGEDEFFLMVRSIYSDEFKNNKHRIYSELAENPESYDKEKTHSRLISVLVVDWQVPEEFGECTPENVEKLLHEYPQIADGVDAFATNNANFIEKKSQA